MPNPFSPEVAGHGSELTNEEYQSIVITPLQAESAVLSIPGVESITTAVPYHLPLMREVALDDTAWAAPNDAVAEVEPDTDELVLMDRGVKSLKIIVKFSSETLRSGIDSMAGAQRTISNQIVKAVDKALLLGSVPAGIGGLVAAAGTTVAHDGGVINSVYDELVDALATAESAYAEPTSFVMSPRTIAVLRKMKTTQGLPLLSPNLSEAGGDQVLGRVVVPAPQMTVGTIVVVDPRTVHVALDLEGYARILLEAFADHDQVGCLVVSRFDIGCSNPAGLITITGVA